MTNLVEPARIFLTTYIPVISTAVVAIATVILVWLTSKYVRLTNYMVEDIKRSREPSINVDFELPDGFLRFAISNSGLSPAKNIRFLVQNDVDWIKDGSGNAGLARLAPIKNGISYLAPNRTLKYGVGLFSFKGTESENTVSVP